MSHKSKKAVDALRDYLGTDARGIKLLDDVAREMTELRKRYAASAAQSEQSRGVSAASREATERAVEQSRQLQQELTRMKAVVSQREHELADCTAAITELRGRLDELSPDLSESDLEIVGVQRKSEEQFPEALQRTADISAMFNALRRQMTRCPQPAKPIRRQYLFYRLEDVIRDYSGESLLKLGRFVACLAMSNIPAVVFSRMTTKHAISTSDKHKVRVLMWFKTNNVRDDSIHEALYGPMNPKPIRR